MSLQLVRAGNYSVTLVEKGATIASHITDYWSHVSLFSPNSLNMSTLGKQTLNECTISLPDEDAYFTGGKFVEAYLNPLAQFLIESERCNILLNTEVISVGRKNISKQKSIPNRPVVPFQLLCCCDHEEYYLESDVGENNFMTAALFS